METPVPEAADDELPASLQEGPERCILVVDDDDDARRIVRDFFESLHMSTVGAADGHEALARFHDEGPFDLVVLDVMMPGIDGLEVCRRLKASPQGQLTPLLLLSARSDTRSRVAGLYGGADDYLSKPLNLAELAARAEALLRIRDRYVKLAARRVDALDAAMYDSLSGAINDPYFRRRLAEEIARADRYALRTSVLIVDVEGLPEPTESLDYDFDLTGDVPSFAGPADQLLAAAGKAMRATLRGPDLFARLRRSRFAVLLPHTPRGALDPIIKRLAAAVAEVAVDPELDPDGAPAGLRTRIGRTELGPRMDIDSLLAHAEPR